MNTWGQFIAMAQSTRPPVMDIDLTTGEVFPLYRRCICCGEEKHAGEFILRLDGQGRTSRMQACRPCAAILRKNSLIAKNKKKHSVLALRRDIQPIPVCCPVSGAGLPNEGEMK